MNNNLMSVLVLGILGLGFASLLAYLSKKLKVETDPKIDKILGVVAGLNCGACGFPGCRAYAEAAVKEHSVLTGCLPAGPQANDKIAQILGISSQHPEHKKVVICHCGAKRQEKKISNSYHGIKTCKGANLVGGLIDCLYGCLGLGDCVNSCPVGALSIKNWQIQIDLTKCIGCRKCVKVCPRGLFEMVSAKTNEIFFVACNNKDKGLDAKKVCSRGCITCGICTKIKDSPFSLQDNISVLDYSKLDNQTPIKEAISKCPTKCIVEQIHPDRKIKK